MSYKITFIGKLNQKLYGELFNHYSKQIPNLKLVEIPESKGKEPEIEESLKIVKSLKEEDFNIGLFIDGNSPSSIELAKIIDQNSAKTINFIIGGSTGMTNLVKERCNYILSLSSLTLPHQLAKVVLLEQIYRVISIINSRSYHK